MRYYIGPWQWNAGPMPHFAPPANSLGAMDLGTLPEMAVPGSPRRGCLVWTESVLPSEYQLIGIGDMRELKPDAVVRSAFKTLMGHRTQGDTLADCVMDCLTTGADPDGATGPMPIMPGIDGWMDLWTHGRVKGERFEWGRSPHTVKVRRLLRAEFAQLMNEAQAGKLKDAVHHHRVLDFWCDKYGVDDWKEFVPTKLQKDVPGRLKHETSYSDDFNRANESPLASPWAASTGTINLSGNKLTGNSAAMGSVKYSDLSTADHYSQITTLTCGIGQGCGPMVRFSSSAETYYTSWTDTSGITVYKVIAGASTSIGSWANAWGTSPNVVIKFTANGSSITSNVSGTDRVSVTDTSITGNTKPGCGIWQTPGTLDDWSAADLAASGTLYTQLERGTRGVCRGLYTKY